MDEKRSDFNIGYDGETVEVQAEIRDAKTARELISAISAMIPLLTKAEVSGEVPVTTGGTIVGPPPREPSRFL
jgi:hypothetical protein